MSCATPLCKDVSVKKKKDVTVRKCILSFSKETSFQFF
jgi:hypothetical protein